MWMRFPAGKSTVVKDHFQDAESFRVPVLRQNLVIAIGNCGRQSGLYWTSAPLCCCTGDTDAV